MEGATTYRTPARLAHHALAGAIALGASLALHATAASAQRAAPPATTATDTSDTTETTGADTEADSADEPTTPPEATGPEPPTPAWDWRQVLASPRILNRFTSVTVDPRNGDHVVVGTEEGTIIRTFDGGRSWEERTVTPGVVARRSLALRAPSLDALNRHPIGLGAARLEARGNLAPPAAGTPAASAAGSPNASTPPTSSTGAPAPVRPGTASFLASSTLSRDDEISPVRRIAICPGGRFPLIVATSREVFGSFDEGNTFVRLYAAPNGLLASAAEPPVTSVACSPTDPNEVVITVSSLLGILRSTDGGLSFANGMTGAPAAGTNFVTFDEAGARLDPSQRPVLLFAADANLYVGDPTTADGVAFSYPDYDNPSLATWETITWITTTSTGQIWIATANAGDRLGGVRYSPDGGGTWRAADRALFDHNLAVAVLEGTNERAQPRIAVALENAAYSSDDGGRSFQPFFLGITRRAITQMAVSPPVRGEPSRWWITAGGELWSTAPADLHDGLGESSVDARWAREQIRATGSLESAINDAWHATHFDRPNLTFLAARALIPRVSLQLYTYRPAYLSSLVEMGAFNILELRQRAQTADTAILTATWNFGDLIGPGNQDTRSVLYNLRQEVEYVIEDAWHERVVLLQRIARGELDRFETDVARERITALEAVLDTWSPRARR